MKLNLPNLITLSRIPTMFLLVWLMYCEWRWAASLAFWIFIATAVGDWLDGYLARRQNLVSNFGKFMDALTDKILVLGLMVALRDRAADQFAGSRQIPAPRQFREMLDLPAGVRALDLIVAQWDANRRFDHRLLPAITST